MYINEKVLNYVFEDEIKVKLEGINIILKKQDLGMLHLQTGKIVANDPLVLFEVDEFTIAVEPNDYPVSIHVANIETDKRVALAMIKFSDNRPVRWEMALVADQKINELDEDSFYGYGVDSGTGGFMDKTVANKLEQLEVDIYEELEEQFDKTYVHTYNYAIGSVTDDTQNNEVVAFSSGFGDGCYPSYFGFDETGKPCVLVTDFLILE